MSRGRGVRAGELVGRGAALLVAAGCFAAIAWSARQPPEQPSRPPTAALQPAPAPLARPQPTSAAADACAARKEAEIAAIRAQGELTAERRMRIRQIEARACD
jgi:hypothetical protein